MKRIAPIILSLICTTLLGVNVSITNATPVNLNQEINYSQPLPTVSRNDTFPLILTSQMISTLTNAVYSATNGEINLTDYGTGNDLGNYINATFTIILSYTLSAQINFNYNAKIYLPDDLIIDSTTAYLTLTADQTKKTTILISFQAETKVLSDLIINLPTIKGYVFTPLTEFNEIQLPKLTLTNLMNTGLDSQLGDFKIPFSSYLKNHLISLQIPPITYIFSFGNGTSFGNVSVGIQPDYQLYLDLNSTIKATPWLTAGQGLTTGLTFSPSNLNFTYIGEIKPLTATVDTPGSANLSFSYDQLLNPVLNMNVSGMTFATSIATSGVSQSFTSSIVTAHVTDVNLGTATATATITDIILLTKITSPFTWQNLGLLIIGLVVGYFIGIAMVLIVLYRRRKRRFQQTKATPPPQTAQDATKSTTT